jgi:hypothetical protein
MAEVAQTACAGPVAVASPRNRKRSHVAGTLRQSPIRSLRPISSRMWTASASRGTCLKPTLWPRDAPQCQKKVSLYRGYF